MNYAYRLSVLGDESTLRAYEAAQECRIDLDKPWDPHQPFVLRRRYFPTFPRVLRVSRKHLEIHCEETIGMDGEPERTFWVADLSTNGTWLNGELLEKGIRTQLRDGDEILIINDELQDSSRVRFGFRFTVFSEESAPSIPHPPQQFVQEFKEKMASQRLRTKTSKRNRDFEFSDREEDSSKSNGRKKPRKRNDSDNEFSTRPSVSRKKTTFFDDDDDRDSPMKKDGSGSMPPKKSDSRIMKQWTPEEEKKLVEVMAKSEGKSWKEIAIHFPHRSPDAVRNKFKKMSETDKVAKSFWAATISKQQARAAASATTPTATTPEQEEQAPPSLEKDQVQAEPEEEEIKDTSSQQPTGLLPVKEEEEEDRRRKLWTAEEDEQLKQLIKKFRPATNEDWEQIAGKLGRTVKSVKHKYNDHNLKYLLET